MSLTPDTAWHSTEIIGLTPTLLYHYINKPFELAAGNKINKPALQNYNYNLYPTQLYSAMKVDGPRWIEWNSWENKEKTNLTSIVNSRSGITLKLFWN